MTLLSSATGFRDLRGNLLDRDGNGSAGGNFVRGFLLDTASRALPNALSKVAPDGSLIYTLTPAYQGHFHAPGDTDVFTTTLDAGQRLSVVVSGVAPALMTQIDVLDPNGALVATSTAAAPSQSAWATDIAITTAGTYRVRLTAASGSGSYQLQVALNATTNPEDVGGATDNTLPTAVNLDHGAVALQGTADRLAISGFTDGGTPDYFSFSLAQGQSATVVLTELDTLAGGITLELLDTAGIVVSSGIHDAGTMQQVIRSFVASTAGTYYGRVTGTSVRLYDLVITRGADFEREVNGSPARAQDVSVSGQVLGAIESRASLVLSCKSSRA